MYSLRGSGDLQPGYGRGSPSPGQDPLPTLSRKSGACGLLFAGLGDFSLLVWGHAGS